MGEPIDPRDAKRRHREITRQIARLGFVLPGSIIERYTQCGKPTCHCRTDTSERHGPYLTWTRKTTGKTVTRTLTSDQASRYQPWIDNARTLRELVNDLEDLAIALTKPENPASDRKR
jgi:hypothetical protein